MNPFVSVITPVYNTGETLEPYLKAVFSSTYTDFELIIIDDCSLINPCELLKGYNLIYHRSEVRQGSFHARQIGAAMAKGRILLFIDADVIIYSDTIAKIVSVFNENDGIAGLICSYDDAPAAMNTISQFKFLYHHYIHQHEKEYVRSFWTGCGAIKKSVFDQIEGFKHSCLAGFDPIKDIELGYKLTQHHFKIYNAKHIQVKHLKSLDFTEWVRTDIFNRGIPWINILLVYKDFKPNLNINIKSYLSVLSVTGVLISIPLILLNHYFLTVWLLFAVSFFLLNVKIIQFFRVKKGLMFSLKSTILLFVYYFNCIVCVVLGFLLSKKSQLENG